MTQAKFNGTDLPLDFEYKPEYSSRISVLKTITADVVQKQDFYSGDTYYSFSSPLASATIRNLFYNAYIAQSTVVFIDYDSTSRDVLLTEFKKQDESGLYNLSGRMKVIP